MLVRTSSDESPTRNLLLQRLTTQDRTRIEKRCERITLERGVTLFNADTPFDAVYFPETVLVSIGNGSGEGGQIETGVIGSEGVVGWSALIGCSRSTYSAVVQMRTGTAIKIPVRDALSACRASATLLSAMLRFAEIMAAQMAHAIVSHARDPLDRRLSRWLLMRHDRVTGNELHVMHEEISANLGVRRASITDCLHVLEGDQMIRCYRGRIIIRDRTRLEGLAETSYGLSEDYYRTLIGAFGQTKQANQPMNIFA